MSFLFRWYPQIAIFSLTCAFLWFIYMRGYNACQEKHLIQNAKAVEVKNEIRNRPHSVAISIERLQRGTF